MRTAQLFFATALAVLVGASAHAAGVTDVQVGQNPWFPPTGGSGSVVDFDPAGQKAVITKTFTQLGDVPIIIDRGASSGVDTFHVDERVRNDTGIGWTEFHFVFESIDANQELFVSFLNVSNPTGEWTSVVSDPNQLSLFGSVPAGGTFSIAFDLQMTDQVGAFALFGIHEFPTVPEPASLVLIGAGLAALGAARRHGKASRG